MLDIIFDVTQWLNTTMPVETWRFFWATRFFAFINLLLLLFFTGRYLLHYPKVWQTYVVVLPVVTLCVYYWLQLYMAGVTRPVPTYGLVVVNVLSSIIYSGMSLKIERYLRIREELDCLRVKLRSSYTVTEDDGFRKRRANRQLRVYDAKRNDKH